MDRPDKNLSKRIAYEDISKKELIRYGISLEKYSDELEQKILKLDNTVNEACKILSKVEMDGGWYCPYGKFDSLSCMCCKDLKCHDPEAIKEYLLTKE